MEKLPDWLEDLFYSFGIVHGNMWTAERIDPRAWAAKKTLWHRALMKYAPIIINKAIDESFRTGYPDLHKVCGLCEEFSRTFRYEKSQSHTTFQPNSSISPTFQWWLDENGLTIGETKSTKDNVGDKISKSIVSIAKTLAEKRKFA